MKRSRLILTAAFIVIMLGCTNTDDSEDPGSAGYSCPYTSPISTENSLANYDYPVSSLGIPDFIVMTRNLYLGANIGRLLSESDPFLMFGIAGELFEDLIESEFPRRAEGIAREIEQCSADIVALQEVVLIRTGDPDFAYNPLLNSECEEYDFLNLLLASLNRRNLSYKVALISQNADIEVTDIFKDIRITDRDVILVKTGHSYSDSSSKIFEYNLYVDTDWMQRIHVYRGYSHLLVSILGTDIRFINTHLETQPGGNDAIQLLQLNELMSDTYTLYLQGDIIVLTGDFNSGPTSSLLSTTGYYAIIGNTAFTVNDSWVASGESGNGYTCCYPHDLDESAGYFNRRIDHIFFINSSAEYLEVTGAMVTGIDDDEKIYRTDGTRIWSSDHGGMIAGFKIMP